MNSLILTPPEVRAALAGRLGLIVRPVKLLSEPWKHFHMEAAASPSAWTPIEAVEGSWWWQSAHAACEPFGRSPFGSPGAVLAGKETWCVPCECVPFHHPARDRSVVYAADDGKEFRPLGGNWFQHNDDFRWRSSTQMPIEYARIRLTVKAVRVGRVQDILIVDGCSDIDHLLRAGFEDCPVCNGTGFYISGGEIEDCAPCQASESYIEHEFIDSWDARYAKKPGLSWSENPFVWMGDVEVEVVE